MEKLTRREFVQSGLAVASLRGRSFRPRMERIGPRVQIFHDVVNVGVIQNNGKTLLIDSGDGSILDGSKPRIAAVDTVLYTHYHRDQCASAPRLKRKGVKIGVPASEARFFQHATEFWLSADTLLDHRYNFRPEMFVLRESVIPDFMLQPGTRFGWEGITIRVLATPGHTGGSLTYLVDVDGQKVAFTGDLIYGPGQIWEFYSLQKRFPGMAGGYWGFGGAVAELEESLERVVSHNPDVLVPSHGASIKNPRRAVSSSVNNLDALMRNYCTLAAWRLHHSEGSQTFKQDVPAKFAVPMLPPLPPAKLPPWLHRSVSTSSYLQAEDRRIFLFDCGFEPIVHELDRLKRSGAISGIDGIWVSHYHDDHVASVNTVRRRFGGEVYAQKELQDILENPTAYSMPCLFPENIHVDHALSEGEVVRWKGFEMTFYFFPGQTLLHDGLLIEHDGYRVFMSGDSIMNWAISEVCSYNRNFLGKDGAGRGYERCLRLLLKLKPDLLYAAHYGAIPYSEAYLAQTLNLIQEQARLASALFPWDDPNFGLDSHWVRAYPYRQSILPGQPVTLEARVYNHSSRPCRGEVELRAPKGWTVGRSEGAIIAPHSEGAIRLSAKAPIEPESRRDVLGLAVKFDDRNLGEITEAIIDYLR